MSPACPTRLRKRCALCRSLRVETLEKRLLLTAGGLPSHLELDDAPVWQEYHDSLSVSASVDHLQVSVKEPGRLSVWTDADEISHLDPFLALYDGEEDEPRLLTGSDDGSFPETEGGSIVDARIQLHLSEGEYRVSVSPSPFANPESSEGQYALFVSWEPTGPWSGDQQDMTFSVDRGHRAITSADFNNDGQLDLATTNMFSNDVSVLLGLGDGTFRAVPSSFEVGEGPISIVAVDFNNDGNLDLAAANSLSNDVSVLLGRGDGTFDGEGRIKDNPQVVRADETLSAIGDEPKFLTAEDLNGDDYPDLLVANENSDDVSILFGAGDGTFDTAERYATGASPRSVATGHFNNDVFVDVVVPGRNAKTITVLRGRGNNIFEPLPPIDVGNGPHAVAVADFNRDGYADLATANDKGDTVSVLPGDGTDALFRRYNDGKQYKDYPVGGDSEFILTGDFNGDGFADLATGNEDTRDVSILLNNGDGTFEAELRIPVYCIPDELATGDFNADGRQDLAVVSREGRVVVLLGSGDGRFVRDPRPRVGNGPEAVVWADFNGDGLQDLATANGISNDVSVLLGSGGGAFHPETRLPVGGSTPGALAVDDVNGDGHLDLLSVTEARTTFRSCWGTATGSSCLHPRCGSPAARIHRLKSRWPNRSTSTTTASAIECSWTETPVRLQSISCWPTAVSSRATGLPPTWTRRPS